MIKQHTSGFLGLVADVKSRITEISPSDLAKKLMEIYSQQLDFRQGAVKVSNRSVCRIHEDCELSGNAAENSSAKSIPFYLIDVREQDEYQQGAIPPMLFISAKALLSVISKSKSLTTRQRLLFIVVAVFGLVWSQIT